MSTLILKLLDERDMYGYEIIDELKQRSENVFELKAGTLYPLLHTLESKTLLSSYEREHTGKIRKYYKITKAGRKHLKNKLEEWDVYTNAVENVLAYSAIT